LCTFYWSDAVTQVFVAIALLVLWIEYVALLIAAILKKVVSAQWWLLVAWVALVLFYLQQCPIEYVWFVREVARVLRQ